MIDERCQFASSTATGHIKLRNLDEFHLPYLKSLLENDCSTFLQFELRAFACGYGPLMQCSFSVAASAQQQLCCKPASVNSVSHLLTTELSFSAFSQISRLDTPARVVNAEKSTVHYYFDYFDAKGSGEMPVHPYYLTKPSFAQ